jgi:hypothetical protein
VNDNEPYEVTGKKQRLWMLAVICLVILAGLVYVLSQFG